MNVQQLLNQRDEIFLEWRTNTKDGSLSVMCRATVTDCIKLIQSNNKYDALLLLKAFIEIEKASPVICTWRIDEHHNILVTSCDDSEFDIKDHHSPFPFNGMIYYPICSGTIVEEPEPTQEEFEADQ